MKVIFERILKEMRLSTQEKITGDVFCRLFLCGKRAFWSSKVIVLKNCYAKLVKMAQKA